MTVSTSLLAYQDCIAIMDEALTHPKGGRFRVSNIDEATHLRMRLHYARKLNREANAKTYEPNHPMHGCSEYDCLTIRFRNVDGDLYVYCERTDVPTVQVEAIPENETAQIAHEPQKLIEPPKEKLPETFVQDMVTRRV